MRPDDHNTAEDTPPAADKDAKRSVDTTQRQVPGTRNTEAAPEQPGQPGTARQDQPKMPHERDESVDMTHGTPDKNVEQAYRDVKRGLQDTDRGPVADKAYQKQK